MNQVARMRSMGRLATRGVVRPAGQLSDAQIGIDPGTMNFTPGDVGLTGVDLQTRNATTGQTVQYDANGNVIGQSQGLSSRDVNALFGMAGQALSLAGSTIAQIVSSNNATARASLESQALVRITQLQNEAAAAAAEGRVDAATAANAQIDTLNQLRAQLNQRPDSTSPWLYAGIGLLAAIGVGVIVMRKNSSPRASRRVKKNPACGCTR